MPSMTVRISLGGFATRHRRMRSPAYFSPSRRLPPRSRKAKKPSARTEIGATTTARPASSDRGALEVDRQRAARLVVQARAHAGDERARRGHRERRAQAARRAGPATRRRCCRRASPANSSAPRPMPTPCSADSIGPSANVAALRDDDGDEREHDAEQPAGLLEERKRRALVVDPEVGGRQRARDERRQEGPDAGRAGEAGALENVDQQLQRVRYRGGRMTIDDRDARTPGEPRTDDVCSRPPSDVARPRALRRPVRGAHEGHEVLGDARPHGAHRAQRHHLARRRPARHVVVSRRVLRGDHELGRRRLDARARCSTGRPRA